MGNVLILAEHAKGHAKKVTLNTITFGQQIAAKLGGAEVHLLIMGDKLDPVVTQLQGCGVKTMQVADSAALGHYSTEAFAQVLVQVAKAVNAEVIAAASSALTKDLLPRVAATLDAAMVSEATAVVDGKTFKRPMWAGNAIATVELTTPVRVATVRATEFDADAKNAAPSPVTKVSVTVDSASQKVAFVSFDEVKSERPELTEAPIVVSGGRGTRGQDGMKLIEQLADQLHAAVGWTRAVVDAGWAPNDLQVGQTGKIVAPNLYVAVGVSGAIQHIAGMKGSKTIVAINKDPEAPIFQVADYGLVADLFKAVPELMEEIKKARA